LAANVTDSFAVVPASETVAANVTDSLAETVAANVTDSLTVTPDDVSLECCTLADKAELRKETEIGSLIDSKAGLHLTEHSSASVTMTAGAGTAPKMLISPDAYLSSMYPRFEHFQMLCVSLTAPEIAEVRFLLFLLVFTIAAVFVIIIIALAIL
jgi:hypothetical protein